MPIINLLISLISISFLFLPEIHEAPEITIQDLPTEICIRVSSLAGPPFYAPLAISCPKMRALDFKAKINIRCFIEKYSQKLGRELTIQYILSDACDQEDRKRFKTMEQIALQIENPCFNAPPEVIDEFLKLATISWKFRDITVSLQSKIKRLKEYINALIDNPELIHVASLFFSTWIGDFEKTWSKLQNQHSNEILEKFRPIYDEVIRVAENHLRIVLESG